MQKKRKSREMVNGIMRAMKELESMLRDGARPEDRFIVHKIGFPEPGSHAPAAIRKLRTRLGLSQSQFARMIGISTILMQGWEQGVRQPSLLARRLLDTISVDPVAWLTAMWKGSRRRQAG